MIWAPGHTRFVLNYYCLCDSAYPIVYEITPEGKLKRLPSDTPIEDDDFCTPFWREFEKSYQTETSFDHSYIYGVAWLDEDTILLGGCAHGNQDLCLAVDSLWCQLYSLKDNTMSAKLRLFNRNTKRLPNRDYPPHEGVSRGHEDTPSLEKNGQYKLTLPQEEGGQTFTGEGKSGIIRSNNYYDDNKKKWIYDYLIMNVFQGERGYCQLMKRTEKNQFSKKTALDLSRDFIKAAGWKLPKGAISRIYALASLDESHFVLQGYAINSKSKQIAWKTLIFDAREKTFTEDLFGYNDSRVKMYTIPSQRDDDE